MTACACSWRTCAEMRAFRSLSAIPAEFRNSTVSIGNFDGVHQGHQFLLRKNREIAAGTGTLSSVLTFDPHPTRVVAPQRAPALLTTMEQRLELIARAGIEQTLVLTFDVALSQMTPLEFVRVVLAEGLGAKTVLVGDNFHFGSRQAGDVSTLRRLGEEFGYRTEVVSGVNIRGRFVSSTAVREAILAGQVRLACRLLGRPCSLEGTVVSGFGIGSKQTVPTLNLDTRAEVIPGRGVYVTRTLERSGERVWPSITNVGFRPTFGGDRLTIETFLLSSLEQEPPTEIRVEFLHRIRDERKFDSPPELKAQILRDVARAQAWFRRCKAFRRT